jgi:hypothetical protein
MGKLQTHEKRVNEIQEDHFFQSKIVLDIPEKEEDLEEEIEVVSINQTIDRMKGTGRLVQLAVAIRDPNLTVGLTNQKLNDIIVKR